MAATWRAGVLVSKFLGCGTGLEPQPGTPACAGLLLPDPAGPGRSAPSQQTAGGQDRCGLALVAREKRGPAPSPGLPVQLACSPWKRFPHQVGWSARCGCSEFIRARCMASCQRLSSSLLASPAVLAAGRGSAAGCSPLAAAPSEPGAAGNLAFKAILMLCSSSVNPSVNSSELPLSAPTGPARCGWWLTALRRRD